MNRMNVNELTLKLLGVENPSTSITMPHFNNGAMLCQLKQRLS